MLLRELQQILRNYRHLADGRYRALYEFFVSIERESAENRLVNVPTYYAFILINHINGFLHECGSDPENSNAGSMYGCCQQMARYLSRNMNDTNWRRTPAPVRQIIGTAGVNGEGWRCNLLEVEPGYLLTEEELFASATPGLGVVNSFTGKRLTEMQVLEVGLQLAELRGRGGVPTRVVTTQGFILDRTELRRQLLPTRPNHVDYANYSQTSLVQALTNNEVQRLKAWWDLDPETHPAVIARACLMQTRNAAEYALRAPARVFITEDGFGLDFDELIAGTQQLFLENPYTRRAFSALDQERIMQGLLDVDKIEIERLPVIEREEPRRRLKARRNLIQGLLNDRAKLLPGMRNGLLGGVMAGMPDSANHIITQEGYIINIPALLQRFQHSAFIVNDSGQPFSDADRDLILQNVRPQQRDACLRQFAIRRRLRNPYDFTKVPDARDFMLTPSGYGFSIPRLIADHMQRVFLLNPYTHRPFSEAEQKKILDHPAAKGRKERLRELFARAKSLPNASYFAEAPLQDDFFQDAAGYGYAVSAILEQYVDRAYIENPRTRQPFTPGEQVQILHRAEQLEMDTADIARRLTIRDEILNIADFAAAPVPSDRDFLYTESHYGYLIPNLIAQFADSDFIEDPNSHSEFTAAEQRQMVLHHPAMTHFDRLRAQFARRYEMGRRDFLGDVNMPDELRVNTLRFLPDRNLSMAKRVSREWHRIASDWELWRDAYNKRYPLLFAQIYDLCHEYDSLDDMRRTCERLTNDRHPLVNLELTLHDYDDGGVRCTIIYCGEERLIELDREIFSVREGSAVLANILVAEIGGYAMVRRLIIDCQSTSVLVVSGLFIFLGAARIFQRAEVNLLWPNTQQFPPLMLQPFLDTLFRTNSVLTHFVLNIDNGEVAPAEVVATIDDWLWMFAGNNTLLVCRYICGQVQRNLIPSTLLMKNRATQERVINLLRAIEDKEEKKTSEAQIITELVDGLSPLVEVAGVTLQEMAALLGLRQVVNHMVRYPLIPERQNVFSETPYEFIARLRRPPTPDAGDNAPELEGDDAGAEDDNAAPENGGDEAPPPGLNA